MRCMTLDFVADENPVEAELAVVSSYDALANLPRAARRHAWPGDG